MSNTSIIQELNRRGVFRAAGAYLVSAWAIAKTAEMMLEKFSAPEWALQAVLAFLLVSFPVVITLAWIHGLASVSLDVDVGDGVGGANVNVQSAEGAMENKLSADAADVDGNQFPSGLYSAKLLWSTVILLALAGAGWWYGQQGSESSLNIERLAVLPPDNLIGEEDSEYYIMGLHDALISQLGETLGSNVDVIGRRSVLRYAQTELSIPEIAEELDVDALVESTVIRSGDSAVINARLTQANPERQLWTDRYDRRLEEIGTLYADIASALAGEISGAVLPQSVQQQVVPAAYDAYLLAKHYRSRLTDVEGDLRKTIALFTEATTHDPNFAPAYAGRAEAWSTLGWANIVSPDEAWPQMKIAAERAIALDAEHPDVRVASALMNQNYLWNWEQAEADLSAALASNPDHIEAILQKAQLMSILGRHDEAIALNRRAITLEPGVPFVEVQLVWSLAYADRLDEAESLLDNILARHPGFGFAMWFRTHIYTRQGRYAEGIVAMEEVIALLAGDDLTDEYALIGYLHGRLGRGDIARDYLARIEQQATEGRYVSPIQLSLVHMGLGDYEEALALLREGVETRAGWVPLLPLYAKWYEPIRERPEFQALMARVDLSI